MINLIRIKELMGGNEYTKKFMAQILELSPTSLKKKLDGKVEFKASEVKKMAELFNVGINELYK